MKTKTIIKSFLSINKVKDIMIKQCFICDDEEKLKDIIRNKTDVQEKNIKNTVDAILYIMKNYVSFTDEIENSIISKVSRLIKENTKNNITYQNLINLLHDYNIIQGDIIDDYCYDRYSEEQKHTLVVKHISCTKSLFIDYKIINKIEETYKTDKTDVIEIINVSIEC